MKYIKDRFYNSRKTSPSFGAPAQGLFTREERTASFLRVVSAKVQQVFETTKYSEKFFFESPIRIRKPIGRSEAAEGRNLQSYLPYISLETVSDTPDQSDHRARSGTPLF